MIKVCLNGARSRAEHPAVPVTPAELAAAAKASVAAGAAAIHMHPRDADGRETLDPESCARALGAVRAACPGVPVGLSTGFWITGSVGAREASISQWTALPDFVSVNLAEEGATALAASLDARGVGVEAGLATPADAKLLLETGLDVVRVLVEVEGEAEEAIATADAIEAVLERGAVEAPLLEHGFGVATWRVIERALARGYDVRIGLEDTLLFADGSPAAENAALVAAVAALAASGSSRARPQA
jgi:uncharacterized protein (DUF849 family)